MRLSAVLITCNEEKKVGECLESIAFADEIVVVDSGSHDRTSEIVKSRGARFFTRILDDFASQRNFALQQAAGDWILFIDADERVSPQLREQIQAAVSGDEGLHGYTLHRINHIFGGPMRFGAHQSDRPMRLVRRGKGRWEGLVHERLVIEGPSGALNGELKHVTYQSLEEYFSKFNLFTTLDAREMIRSGQPLPARWKTLLRPAAEFVYYYFLRQGFRDGWRGFQYQVLSSLYIFVKHVKAHELRREIELKGPGAVVI